MKMNAMKRLSSIVLALTMMLAMAMTVSAADPKTLTIKNPVEGHTYTAYQILTGELVESGELAGQLTNLDWGTGISDAGKSALKTHLGLPDSASAAQVAAELEKIGDDSTAMDAVAQILGDNVAGTGTPLTTSDSGVSATVDQGYYVILDTKGEGAASESTISKYMVQVVGDVSITTKAGTTTSQKTVQDGTNAKAEFMQTNIGKEQTFYLVAKLPADYAAYDAFYMNFKDTMYHMDFVGLTSVTVKRDVTADADGVLDPTTGNEIGTISAQDETDTINGYQGNIPKAVTDTVTDTESTTWNVEILDLKQVFSDAEAGDCVVIEYQAKLNTTAVMNTANENKFTLEFSDNPNNTWKPKEPSDKPNKPIGETPEDQADLYTTELELLKKDGTTGDILTGAEFTLTSEDATDVVIKTSTTFTVNEKGEYWKLKNDTYTKDAPTPDTSEYYDSEEIKYAPTVTTAVTGKTNSKEIKAEVGKDGKVTFSGLGEGTYILSETKTPTGYNTMDDVEVKITFNKEDKTFGVTGLDNLVTDILNYSGSTLPSTGGIGTTIFYVVGGILVVGAVVLLVVKKRMSHQG